ncbi:hypothetical protein K440DRAFT_656618 [Wilcoxina mikolae CBS 423.85]|nr:hypothetical protein K440DRAFT_656618 [Wilcoxina mikolae CBS 423.85]
MNNYLNALFVFLPLGIISGAVGWDPNAVFALNSLALVPLPGLLSFAAGEILVYINNTVEGLLNMVLGNVILLIIGIISVTQGEIRIAQSFVIGSILSKTLLGLGVSFFVGGLRYHEQTFNSTIVRTMVSLSVVSASLFVIFGVLFLPSSDYHPQEILMLSHVIAYMLLLLWVLWFLFRFRTHTDLSVGERYFEEYDERELRPSQGHLGPSFFVILIMLPCVVVSARYLMASVDGVVKSGHINRTFIGLFLLPISTYTVNHIQALTITHKNKMDKVIELTLGASVDITFVTLPVLILIGRAIHQPMSMQFHLLETVLVAVSVSLTARIVSDGKGNYLKGLMLLVTYFIIILIYIVCPDIPQGP